MLDDNVSQSQADTLMQQMERQVPVNRSASPRMARVQTYAFPKDAGDMPPAEGVPFERLHQTMLGDIRTLAFDITRQKPAVTLQPLGEQTFSEWRDQWAEPCQLHFLKMEPLGVSAVLALEGSLVCGLVDLIFGGDGSPPRRVRRKVFSHSENQVANKFMDRLLQVFTASWSEIMPVSFQRSRMEIQPQFANFLPDSDSLCGFRFVLSMGASSCGFNILFPAAAMRELQERFLPDAGGGRRGEGWEHQLRRKLEGAQVEMVAELATVQLNISELVSLQQGDIIALPVPTNLTVRVGDKAVFASTFGVSQGRHAVRVEQRLAGLSEWTAAGGDAQLASDEAASVDVSVQATSRFKGENP